MLYTQCMIDVSTPKIYKAALNELAAFKQQCGRSFRGRFFQIFLGMKFYQDRLPNVTSPEYIKSNALETLLDDLYTKMSRPAEDCVLMLFENEYHARSGQSAPGQGPQNTWRNNFNFQKGIMCFAPPKDLSDQEFLQSSRLTCKYLRPAEEGVLAGATCSLASTTAKYRNEDHLKWIRKDPNTDGYSFVDASIIANFLPYIAPNGQKTPLLPLVVGLYYDSFFLSDRMEIELMDFASDFNFSLNEMNSYFDDSTINPFTARLLKTFPKISYSPLSDMEELKPPVVKKAKSKSKEPKKSLPLPTIATKPPNINTGWEAEQFVANALRENGWVVYDVSRQRRGYDLVAQKEDEIRYIDVKSSLSFCNPTLTGREWQQATAHAERYLLAVIENFNPQGQNLIHWIVNPAKTCSANECTSVEYRITRSSWQTVTTSITKI